MKEIKKIRHIFLVIFFLFGIIILSMNFTNSKYISANEIQVFSGIANPKVILKSEDKKILEALNSDKIYYEFSVNNFDENKKLSETKFKYNIIFEITQENAPIKINLYKKTLNGNEKIDLENNKTISPEILNLEMTSNNYIVELFYDISSTEIMNDNFKVSVVVQAVQEEVLDEK